MTKKRFYCKQVEVNIPKEWIEECVKDKKSELFRDTIRNLEDKQKNMKKSIDYLYKELKELKKNL